MSRSAPYRQAILEIARALCVLGLVVFGLGSAPTPVGQIGASPAVAAAIVQAATAENCGGGWGDDRVAHAPCHACRGTIAALPPAPVCAEPVVFAATTIAYFVAAPPAPAPRLLRQGFARGPPIA